MIIVLQFQRFSVGPWGWKPRKIGCRWDSAEVIFFPLSYCWHRLMWLKIFGRLSLLLFRTCNRLMFCQVTCILLSMWTVCIRALPIVTLLRKLLKNLIAFCRNCFSANSSVDVFKHIFLLSGTVRLFQFNTVFVHVIHGMRWEMNSQTKWHLHSLVQLISLEKVWCCHSWFSLEMQGNPWDAWAQHRRLTEALWSKKGMEAFQQP